MNRIIFFLLLMVYTCHGSYNLKQTSDFHPTNEWQEIEPDQRIPRGLHVRINLTTGKKEAKFLDDKIPSNNQHGLINIPKNNVDEEESVKNDPSRLEDMKELVKALKNIKDDFHEKESKKKVKKKFRSIEQLREELADVNLEFTQGTSMISRLINDFTLATSNKKKLSILGDFEYMLHELDAAVDFTVSEGTSKVIMVGLNSTNVKVKMSTLSVIGSAAQSNPEVQIDFLKHKVLLALMHLLTHENDVKVQLRTLYSISSLIRGFPYGQKKFIKIGGLDTLLELFDENIGDVRLQIKVINLIRNLLEEKENAIGERALQLQAVNLDRHLAAGGWCPTLASMLQVGFYRDRSRSFGGIYRFESTLLDPLIDSMSYLASRCKSDFIPYKNVLLNLADMLNDQYHKDVDNREPFLNQELLDSVVVLIRQISSRDEL